MLVPLPNIWLPQNIISGCMKGRWYDSSLFIYESESCSVMSDSLQPHGIVHGILQARTLEWVAVPFSRGIFPTRGSNPDLPHCRQILYQLSHQESPRILEWVAYPFSSRSSRPRNQTRVPCIAGGFFTSWTTREVVRIMSWWPVSFCTIMATWVLTYQACFNSLLSSFLLRLKLCHVWPVGSPSS